MPQQRAEATTPLIARSVTYHLLWVHNFSNLSSSLRIIHAFSCWFLQGKWISHDTKPRHLTNYWLVTFHVCYRREVGIRPRQWNGSCSGRNTVFCDVVVLANHFHSMAFLIYMFIAYLIHLYTTSGRNAANRKSENIEMSRSAWYSWVDMLKSRRSTYLYHLMSSAMTTTTIIPVPPYLLLGNTEYHFVK